MGFDRVYVIALPERVRYILETLEAVGIFPEVVPAVLKETLRPDVLLSQRRVTPDALETLNSGQVACHLSHVAVLEKFLSEPGAKSCLIFEDDLAPPAPTILAQIAAASDALAPGWDLLYLGRCWDNCGADVPVGDSQVVRCFSPLCRHAYAVSRQGAQTLVAHAFPMDGPGDHMYADLITAGKLKTYCSKPSLFFQNREELGSTLGNYNKLRECRANPANQSNCLHQ